MTVAGTAVLVMFISGGPGGLTASRLADRLVAIVPAEQIARVWQQARGDDAGATTDAVAEVARQMVVGAAGLARDLAGGGPPTEEPTHPPPPLCLAGGGTTAVNLEAEEASGGHILERHVGRSDQQLLQRSQTGRGQAASTFPDRRTAEQVIASGLECLADQIADWLASLPPPRRLECDTRFLLPIGRTQWPGAMVPEPSRGLRIVIERSGDADAGYRILTAFPKEGQWLTNCRT